MCNVILMDVLDFELRRYFKVQRMLFKLSHRELNGAFQRWGENVEEVKALRTR